MAQGKVEICGVNTSKLPLLKESEKEVLLLRVKEGDMAAKEEYIKGNLRLVLSVIKRFSNANEKSLILAESIISKNQKIIFWLTVKSEEFKYILYSR